MMDIYLNISLLLYLQLLYNSIVFRNLGFLWIGFK